jgi:peptidyl-prolyl cis-trans isomerase D
MIIDIRRHLKSPAYRSVIIIAIVGIIVSFALPPVIKQIGRDAEWAATVNGAEISEATFRQKVMQQQEFLASIRQEYGPYATMLLQSMGQGNDAQELALNLLVKEELLAQVAEKIGIQVHSDDIAEKLSNPQFVQKELNGIIPPYFISANGTINEKALRRYLQKSGISLGQLDTLVERAVSRRMVAQLVMLATYVPLFDIKQSYLAERVAKKFSIVTFALDSYVKKAKQVPIDQQKIEQFFESQNALSKRYVVPEKRAGVMWTFSPQSYGLKITDEDVESYYQAHKATDFVKEPTKIQVRRILLKVPDATAEEAVKEQAQLLRQELGLGEAIVSFAQKAKEVSQDTQSAQSGGLLSSFARGEQSAAIDRIAFLLKEDGEISPVFRSQEGYEILQRVSKTMRSYKPLSAVAADIKKIVLNDKFKKQFPADIKAVTARAGDSEMHRAAFIKEQGGKKSIISTMADDGTQVAKALFTIKKPQELECFIDAENGIVVQLTTVEKQYTQSLDSIKATVTNDMYDQEAQALMKADLTLAYANADIAALSAEFGAKLEKTGWIKADSKEIKDLETRGIPTDRIIQLEKIGQRVMGSSPKHGFLIQLDSTEAINEEDFKESVTKIKRRLEQERVSLLIEGFIASLYRNAKLNVNESVLNLYKEYSI